MEKKYTVLRVIATLYKIAGVLIALGTILVVILVIVGGFTTNQTLSEFGLNPGPLYTFLGVIISFVGGALSAIGVYAIGEALYLLIGLEENTRFTAILLRDRFYPQPAVPMQPQPMMPPQPIAPPPSANPPYPPVGN